MKRKNKPKYELPNLSTTRAAYEKQKPQFESGLYSFYQEIRSMLEKNGFTPTIKYRVKRFENYFEKLRRIRISPGKGQKTLSDFFALRIICPFLEDIETVEKLLMANFDVIENERKSSQHSFREFGYDSVHLMIRPSRKLPTANLPGVRNVCEVQLRTILQDAWAEVEHELVYKSDVNLPKGSIRRKLASLNATLTLSDLIFQEIRDYQNELRQHGRKRREAVSDNSLDLGLINISAPLQNGPRPIPSTLRTRLEKTMLRALEAHGNNDLDTAIELYGIILGMKLDRKMRSLVYNHRGMAHFSSGNQRQAIQDFSQAIRFDPASSRSYANRGLCNRVMKRFGKALIDYELALETDPGFPDSYFGRAQTYYDMQQYELARIDCLKALEIKPDHTSARELLSAIEHRTS